MPHKKESLSEVMGLVHAPECQYAYGVFKEAKRILIKAQKGCKACAARHGGGAKCNAK